MKYITKIIIGTFLALLLPIVAFATYTIPLVTTTTTPGYAYPFFNLNYWPIQAPYFIASSTTSTSTFANGLNLTGGCFAISGSCLTSGGGGGSADHWATSTDGTSIYNTNLPYNVGIGTTTPASELSIINGNNAANLVIADTYANGDVFSYGAGSISAGESVFADSDFRSYGLGTIANGETVDGTLISFGIGSVASGQAVGASSTIESFGRGSYALGVSSGGTIQSLGTGSIAAGNDADYTDSTAQIVADADGAMAIGHVDTEGQIDAEANGAMASGEADSGGSIQSSVAGSIANGLANLAGTIQANGAGSSARGFSSDTDSNNNGSQISANNSGATAEGIATNGGQVLSENSASFTNGEAIGSGSDVGDSELNNSADASTILGGATNGGQIQTYGSGGLAGGLADGSTGSGGASLVRSSSAAAFAYGYASNGAQLISGGNGSWAGGDASGDSNGGIIGSFGSGSLAFGSLEGNGGYIEAASDGSFAGGVTNADGGGIVAVNQGAIAYGVVDGAGQIGAEGVGGLAIGDSESTNDIISDEQGGFAGGYANTGSVGNYGKAGIAYGDNVLVNNDYSTAIGQGLEVDNDNSYAFGMNFDNATTSSFMVGYSTIPTLEITDQSTQLNGTTTVQGDLNLPTALTDSIGSQGANGQILSSTGTATKWVTNAGGLAGSTDLEAQTTAISPLITITSPNDGNNHTYMISGYLTVTAIAASTIHMGVTYTDENGNGQNLYLYPTGLTSQIISTTGVYAFSPIPIRVGPNKSIIVSAGLGGASSVTYDVGAYINQVN